MYYTDLATYYTDLAGQKCQCKKPGVLNGLGDAVLGMSPTTLLLLGVGGYFVWKKVLKKRR